MVETYETAQACIELLRNMNVGTATFMILVISALSEFICLLVVPTNFVNEKNTLASLCQPIIWESGWKCLVDCTSYAVYFFFSLFFGSHSMDLSVLLYCMELLLIIIVLGFSYIPFLHMQSRLLSPLLFFYFEMRR